ncbi:hypothetical protein An15g04020 [Aspergillus niger]|uniref:Uncharacterized protein n=2 Tax=Aspergillus niger TaxID=5061 RepID=A5ABZ8_ASPNC|nr:hypothetical protein An15g04020 [Aspergillus niger]CAK97270.1 hypothetical protein An15g04020 [Aspergillus niger]
MGAGNLSLRCDAEKGITRRCQAGCQSLTYTRPVQRWRVSPDPNPDRSRTRKYSGPANACQYGGKLAANPEAWQNWQNGRLRVRDIFKMRGKDSLSPSAVHACSRLLLVIEAEDRVTLVLALNFPEFALSDSFPS